MFRLMHEMRVRVMTAPAFTGDRILATILFERTMDGKVDGKPVARVPVRARHRTVPQGRSGPRRTRPTASAS